MATLYPEADTKHGTGWFSGKESLNEEGMGKTAPRMILASANFSIVIPGAADGPSPGIHDFAKRIKEYVDARLKAGHDVWEGAVRPRKANRRRKRRRFDVTVRGC
jgi:hypothetical protein